MILSAPMQEVDQHGNVKVLRLAEYEERVRAYTSQYKVTLADPELLRTSMVAEFKRLDHYLHRITQGSVSFRKIEVLHEQWRDAHVLALHAEHITACKLIVTNEELQQFIREENDMKARINRGGVRANGGGRRPSGNIHNN